MTKFKTVDECLKAGYKWEDCVKFTMTDKGMKNVIKKTCPLPMRAEIKKQVFDGKELVFSPEKD